MLPEGNINIAEGADYSISCKNTDLEMILTFYKITMIPNLFRSHPPATDDHGMLPSVGRHCTGGQAE